MFETVKNVGGLRRFLNCKAKTYNGLLTEFTRNVELDVQYQEAKGDVTFHNQMHWLAWHSVNLPVAATSANEAAILLHYMKNLGDDAEIPEMIRKTALTNILADMRLASRSTSASSNLIEDAKRAFWIEVGNLVLTTK